MPTAAALRGLFVKLLVRLVFGVRQAVLDRPFARAVLRAAGRPAILLMHRTAGPSGGAAATPAAWREPVLRLPLDYTPARAWPLGLEVLVVGDDAARQDDLRAVLGRLPAGARVSRIDRLADLGEQPAAESLTLVLRMDADKVAWRQAINSLAASAVAVAGVIEAFSQLPRLGLLAPRTPASLRKAMAWGEDFPACRKLAAAMGFALYADSPFDEPAGGMFWARSVVVRAIAASERAAGPDVQAAHKLTFHACERAGFRWSRAGDEVHPHPHEAFWRADMPRRLQRALTDCGRSLLIPGRPPRAPVERRSEAKAKAEFRRACREELDAFLASGERLALPTSPDPEVTVLIVLFNQAELTFQCLRSLVWALDRPSEVILFDNGSSDDTGALLDRIDGARIVRNGENLHFLRGVNAAADLAAGRYLLLLNNDTRVTPGSIAAAVARLETESDLGAVGGKIELLDGTLQEAGSIVWSQGGCVGYGRGQDPWAPEFQFRRDVDYCSGAFLMLRRAQFDAMGRFDPAFAPAYYEETDLCLRLWEQGLRVAYEPRVHISHFEFGSSTSSAAAVELQQAHQALFAERHAQRLAAAHAAPGARPLEARMRGRDLGRVLVIEDQVPFPHLGSGYPRALDILKAITAAGWFVSFLPLAERDVDYAAAYEILPPDVEFLAELPAGGLEAVLRERAGYYDAVLVSRPENMRQFRVALARAPQFIDLGQVVYDAEAIFAMRDLTRAELRGERFDRTGLARELELARGAGAVFAVNADEAQNFAAAGAETVRVLGHARLAAPTPSPFAARRDLLFVGALDEEGAPNADSLSFFVREVMPELDRLIGDGWVLRVVGRNGAPSVQALGGPRVHLLGRVDDVAALYDQARVFIAPTRFAAGVPMKVHEATAAGLPSAVTGLLARQLGWRDGEAVAVGDGARGFAEAVARLYVDEALWRQVRDGGLARVRDECDPEAFARTVTETLAAVAGPQAASSSSILRMSTTGEATPPSSRMTLLQ